MAGRSMVDAFERGFGRWTRLVLRHRGWAIAASLALAAAAATALPRLHMDNSIEAFLHDDDPVVVALDAFRDRFGRDDWIVVAVRTDDVFSVAQMAS